MSFLDRLKAGAQEAASIAKREVSELQLKRQLDGVYADAGRRAVELAGAGTLTDPALVEAAAQVRTIREQLDALAREAAGEAPPAAPAEPAEPAPPS
jgi:hypothetical protein